MKKTGKELEFISQINRDGSGTHPVAEGYVELLQNKTFDVRCLSLTEETFIASCFNSFVVRLKNKDKNNNY